MSEKRQENSVHISDNKSKTFGQIAENIDDIIWKLDLKSLKFTYISPSIEKIRGISAEEAMSKSLKESLPEDEYQRISEKIKELFKAADSGKDLPRDYRFKTKHFKNNNEIIWLEVKATLILDENNQAYEAIGVSRDITIEEKRRIELEVGLEREKFFADIIRNSSQPIGIGYEDGSGMFLNDAGFELIGYTKEEAESLSWMYDITPFKWIPIEIRILKKCKETKKFVSYKKEYIHKSGKIIPVELMVHPKYDTDGKFLHFIAFINDITEIEDAKKELKFSNERLEFALKGANDGIWDWDLKTNYLYMSPRYLEIIGYDENEVNYHIDFFIQLIHKDELEKVKLSTEDYKASKHLRKESTFHLKHKNGRFIPVLSRTYKILDNEGNIKRIVGTLTDLTELNTLKELLEENETKYKYLFDHSNIGIGISTIEGQLLEANEYLLNLFQISRKDLHTIQLKDYYKVNRVRDQFIEKITSEGNVKNFQFELIQKSGKPIWVSLSSKKLLLKGKVRFINAIANIDHQIKSEQKLKESEERFKQLSKLTTEGILIHDNGKVLDINDSLLKILGYTRNNILGKSFIQYCCTRKYTESEIADALNSSYKTFILSLKTKNGERVPVELSGRSANFRGQKAQVTSFLDISARIESESTIKLLNTAVEQSSHGVVITDKSSVIQYVNSAFTKITKYEASDIIGNKVSVLGSGFHSPDFFKNIWNTITKGNTWKGEFYNKDKFGNQYWANSTITPIKNNSGEITNFLSIMENVSQRKKEKEEIEKLNSRHILAVEAARFGFWEYNIETKEVFWDDNMYDLFALDKDSEQDLFNYFVSLIGKKAVKNYRRSIYFNLQQKKVVDLEIKVNLKGEVKIFNNHILANPAPNKEMKTVLGITYDITEQKRFEAELIEKTKKAEESDQLKSAFLANMSHEIRTPLNGIIGFTSLLEDDFNEFSKEDIIKYLNIISSNGTHLLSLVNDIIDISKIESGQLVIAQQEFKLGKVVSKLEDTLKTAVHSNVDLIFDHSLDELLLTTDSTRLTQILTNLIGNATKFTNSGHIYVGNKVMGKHLQMWVEDTGSGIKNDAKSLIFERFSQGQPIKDQLLGGTGLGLSITKGLVKLLGGNIWFESEEGKGSTFYIKILIKNL